MRVSPPMVHGKGLVFSLCSISKGTPLAHTEYMGTSPPFLNAFQTQRRKHPHLFFL
jgi:hypothetical protein